MLPQIPDISYRKRKTQPQDIELPNFSQDNPQRR